MDAPDLDDQLGPGPLRLAVLAEDNRSGDVFSGVVGSALLANGRAVQIAPARPADLGRVRRFYQRLGDTSTYYRFFGIRRALPECELTAMVCQDVSRHVALLASIGPELIGIGEFIIAATGDEAEIAFVVADGHHGEGVATLLLERLAVIARRCGVRRFVATTLAGNDDMRLVFRTVGLTQQSHFDGDVIDISFDLSSLERLEAEAEARYRLALAAHDEHQQPDSINPMNRSTS